MCGKEHGTSLNIASNLTKFVETNSDTENSFTKNNKYIKETPQYIDILLIQLYIVQLNNMFHYTH